jgi:hypothetical protein
MGQPSKKRALTRGHFLPVLLIAISLVGLSSTCLGESVQAEGQNTVVWSADFETGDNSQFNGRLYDTCSKGVVGVSTTTVHNGRYAGYFAGASSSPPNCREYVTVNFITSEGMDLYLSDFYWESWFYVPTMTLAHCASGCWVSFATFSTKVDFNYPFVIDSESNRQVYVWVVQGGYAITQNLVSAPIKWPFDTWFKLSILARGVGTSQAEFTMYQDDVPIVHSTSNLMPGGLSSIHEGLYMGSSQPSWAVYNDDILVQSLLTGSSSESPPTVSSTTRFTATATTHLTEITTSRATTLSASPPAKELTCDPISCYIATVRTILVPLLLIALIGLVGWLAFLFRQRQHAEHFSAERTYGAI